MSKLDDIFGRKYDKRLLVPVITDIKQEIKDLILELIGEDVDTLGMARKAYFNKGAVLAACEKENIIKARMRQKVNEL